MSRISGNASLERALGPGRRVCVIRKRAYLDTAFVLVCMLRSHLGENTLKDPLLGFAGTPTGEACTKPPRFRCFRATLPLAAPAGTATAPPSHPR